MWRLGREPIRRAEPSALSDAFLKKGSAAMASNKPTVAATQGGKPTTGKPKPSKPGPKAK